MFSEFLDETEKRRQYELSKENRTDQVSNICTKGALENLTS